MSYEFENNKDRILTHKVRIFPTKNQIRYFKKAFGVRRYVWNMMVDRFVNSDEKFNEYDLVKELNLLAKNDPDHDFFNEVNSMVRQETLRDFEVSLDSYRKAVWSAEKKLEEGEELDISKFEYKRPTKKDSSQSFRYNNKGLPVKPFGKKHFYLTTTRSIGRMSIKCAESLLYLKSDDYRFTNITIKKDQLDRYYACITYEITNHKEYTGHKYDKVGIDMGIKNPYTIAYKDNGYTSKVFDVRDKLYILDRRLAYEQSKLPKKTPGSKRYHTQGQKIYKIYQKIVNIRKDDIYQTVSWLCKNFKIIIYEDFSPNYKKDGWKFNRKKLKHISRYLFLEHLYHKSKYYDNELLKIPRGTPTTQTCSSCGHRFEGGDKLTLEDRVYDCPDCGIVLDRDINAVVNILNYTPGC